MKYIPKRMSVAEYEQTYILRHVVNTVALAYFVMLCVQVLWEFYFIKILGEFGMTVKVLQNLISNPATELLLNVLLTAVIFIVPFVAVLSRERVTVKRLISFAPPKKEWFLPLVLMGVGGCMLANLVGGYVTDLFAQIGVESDSVFTDLPQGVYGILLSYVTICIAPALLEEFAWRGVALNVLRKAGDGFAVFASAMFFGLMHLNMTQIPFAFLVGVILGFAYVKSGSFWTGALIHLINNAVSVTADYALDGADAAVSSFVNIMIIAVSAVAALIGLALYVGRGGNFALDNSASTLTNGQKARKTLTAPLIIADIIISAVLVALL